MKNYNNNNNRVAWFRFPGVSVFLLHLLLRIGRAVGSMFMCTAFWNSPLFLNSGVYSLETDHGAKMELAEGSGLVLGYV